MTPAQAELLRRCIAADRLYRSRIAAGESAGNDERGVEIGPINGVSRRTADVLEAAGLIDRVNMGQYERAFLGHYQPFDTVDD